MVSKISNSEMIIVNELMMKKIELTPDGAPFFSFSPFFSTSTLLTVLLAVLTSESTLLASESEQLEVGRELAKQRNKVERQKNVELQPVGHQALQTAVPSRSYFMPGTKEFSRWTWPI